MVIKQHPVRYVYRRRTTKEHYGEYRNGVGIIDMPDDFDRLKVLTQDKSN